jgi:hypothetical protein
MSREAISVDADHLITTVTTIEYLVLTGNMDVDEAVGFIHEAVDECIMKYPTGRITEQPVH